MRTRRERELAPAAGLAASSAEPSARGPRPRAAAAWILASLAVAGLAAGIMAFYLWIYPERKLGAPLAWDTARYLWKVSLLRGLGFAGMQDGVPPHIAADPARPAIPVVVAALSSLFQVSPFRLIAVVPSAGAAALGLAAGAFASRVLDRPPWQAAVVALSVGTSFFVVRLMGPEGYFDNILATAVFWAAFTAIGAAIDGRGSLVPAVVLLGAANTAHWAFWLYVTAVLLGAAVLYAPASLAMARRRERATARTPSARLLAAVLGGSAVAGAFIAGALQLGLHRAPQTVREFQTKLLRALPRYRLPLMLPAAGAGVAALATEALRDPPGPERERRRFALVLLLSWCGVAAAGVVANLVFDVRVASDRFLASAFALPLLAILGVLAAATLVARHVRPRPLGWAAAGLLVLLVLAFAGTRGIGTYVQQHAFLTARNIDQAHALAAYLSAAKVAPDRPVVVVLNNLDWSYSIVASHMIRASVPAERVRELHFYAGSPRRYLRERPTGDDRGGDADLSRHYLKLIRPSYAGDPVAVILSAYNATYYPEWIRDHPGSVVAEGVAVVRGPRLARPLERFPAPTGRFTTFEVTALGAAAFLVLLLTGLGWSVALFRSATPFQRAALAPAVGIGLLILGGILLDRLGVRLDGAGGAAAPVVVGGLGWLAALAQRLGGWERPPAGTGREGRGPEGTGPEGTGPENPGDGAAGTAGPELSRP